MPIGEFTRAYYAMNRVLEDASSSLQLSKRAAVVLLILYETVDCRMRTSELVRTFQTWDVSKKNSAAKDVAIAKGELFGQDFVMARGGIRNVQLTDEGRGKAEQLIAAIEKALRRVVDGPDKGTSLLRLALSSIEIPKKPVASAELKEYARSPGQTSKKTPKKAG